MPSHTTGPQDRAIAEAEAHADASNNHFAELQAIIEDLDDRLSGWIDAAQCDDPKAVAAKMADYEDQITELKNDLEKSKTE